MISNLKVQCKRNDNVTGILWELVLLSEPIVVFGPSPAATSSLVQTLVSLTAPLR